MKIAGIQNIYLIRFQYTIVQLYEHDYRKIDGKDGSLHNSDPGRKTSRGIDAKAGSYTSTSAVSGLDWVVLCSEEDSVLCIRRERGIACDSTCSSWIMSFVLTYALKTLQYVAYVA